MNFGVRIDEVRTFAGRFNDNYSSYVPSQINAIFSEMLDFLLSEGVRFTIKDSGA